jgi:hypothetical protein
MKCDSCEMVSINGVPCHETGCENAGKRWDASEADWIAVRECAECGNQVDAEQHCCCDCGDCRHAMNADNVGYTAPSAWASYLFNGDASALEEGEQEEIDAMLEHIGFGDPVDCVDCGFTWNPDFGPAGECQTYYFYKRD